MGPSSIQPACLVVDPKDATQEIEGSSFFQGCHPGFPGGNATVDGSEIRETHQLRLVVYPNIYKVFDIPGGAGFLPSTVCVKPLFLEEIWNFAIYKPVCQISSIKTGGYKSPPVLALLATSESVSEIASFLCDH